MRKRIAKRIIGLFLAVLMLTVPLRAQAARQRAVVYTALGDSISTGYRLSDVSGAYVNLYAGYLDTKAVNMGQNGLASSGLLKKLTSDSKVIAQVRKSDIVTVSMGGNDMLNLLYPLVPQKITDLPASVKKLQSAAYQQQFEQGVAAFSQNWSRIVARLKELAPHAVLVVTTLVNPYQSIVVDAPFLRFDLGSFSDRYVRQINQVLRDDAEGNYLLADSYSDFQSYTGGGRLTNANLSQMDFDPHPNAAGHRLIALAHEALPVQFSHGALAVEGAGRLLISPFARSVSAAYQADPLLTCLTSGSTQPAVSWSVVSAGGTGAQIAGDGTLTARRPGKVVIRAVYTRVGSNLSAETERTVTVDYVLSRATLLHYGVPVMTGLAALLLAVALLRRHHKARRRQA